ncbi:hypothetical protein F511_39125 [Dorcoceras hygrometricum]|uniref:Uncharacterized protein n=1 Tax=Dorcoceras hygrometricum TaxID=472368 RepID=A0A2Z7CES0_9LAMI|nr:hypothetical protein F511_39125 [Dorcoceras hygrometricum]
MAQYQILARKPLGPSGTGPKQTLEVKTVSQQPRVCRTVAATCAHSVRRWAADAAQHRARQSRMVAGQHAQRPPAYAQPLRAATVRMVEHAARSYSAPCVQLRRLPPTSFTGKLALQRLAAVDLLIRSTTGNRTPSSACTRRHDKFTMDGISSST